MRKLCCDKEHIFAPKPFMILNCVFLFLIVCLSSTISSPSNTTLFLVLELPRATNTITILFWFSLVTPHLILVRHLHTNYLTIISKILLVLCQRNIYKLSWEWLNIVFNLIIHVFVLILFQLYIYIYNSKCFSMIFWHKKDVYGWLYSKIQKIKHFGFYNLNAPIHVSK